MSEQQKKIIEDMIKDYFEFTDKDIKQEYTIGYTIGYAEAIMNAILTVVALNIDPAGLE